MRWLICLRHNWRQGRAIHESHESSRRVREIFVLSEIDPPINRLYADVCNSDYGGKGDDSSNWRFRPCVLGVRFAAPDGVWGWRQPIVGEWQATKPAMAFEFFQDGTVTWKQGGRTFTGQYKSLDSENIRIDMQGDLGLQSFVLEDIKISSDTLNTTLNGQQIVFDRAGKGNSQNPPVSQAASGSQVPPPVTSQPATAQTRSE